MIYQNITCPNCGGHDIEKINKEKGRCSFCHSCFTINYDTGDVFMDRNEKLIEIERMRNETRLKLQQQQLDFQKEMQENVYKRQEKKEKREKMRNILEIIINIVYKSKPIIIICILLLIYILVVRYNFIQILLDLISK